MTLWPHPRPSIRLRKRPGDDAGICYLINRDILTLARAGYLVQSNHTALALLRATARRSNDSQDPETRLPSEVTTYGSKQGADKRTTILDERIETHEVAADSTGGQDRSATSDPGQAEMKLPNNFTIHRGKQHFE